MTRSLLASALRLGLGVGLSELGPRPTRTPVLYDFEGCPYCRKVREAITMLDLVVDVRPCPKGGTRFRAELATLAPQMRVPTLLDEGVGGERVVLQESDVIVEHLYRAYGRGRPPVRARLGTFGTWTSGLVSGARLRRGTWARASRTTESDYSLVSYEGSADAARVREVLTELEVPYRLLSAAPGSERARERIVPTLRDGHTDSSIVGAAAIVAHLEREHAA